MNLMMTLGIFVSVSLCTSLCMFTVSNAFAHFLSDSYSALWRPWIVEVFFDLVADVV